MSTTKEYAATGACLCCTMGTVPSVPIAALPPAIVLVDGKPVLTETDLPMIPFGTCNAKPSPVPIPCVPSPIKWLLTTKEKDKVTAGGKAILLKSSTILCAQGGKISILPTP